LLEARKITENNTALRERERERESEARLARGQKERKKERDCCEQQEERGAHPKRQ
jgi:hypothetical protein